MRIRSMRERRDNRKYLRLRSDAISDAERDMKNTKAFKQVAFITKDYYTPIAVTRYDGDSFDIRLKPNKDMYPTLESRGSELMVKYGGRYSTPSEADDFMRALDVLIDVIYYIEEAPLEDIYDKSHLML